MQETHEKIKEQHKVLWASASADMGANAYLREILVDENLSVVARSEYWPGWYGGSGMGIILRPDGSEYRSYQTYTEMKKSGKYYIVDASTIIYRGAWVMVRR